ncbi:TetR/AcrR family transcriptional regulator C-terminal domain-containing protein [Nonomuraea sp. NPDC001636]|uniref:TetR/AcrR family transcriptional regulator C-terminal domain-containing protein n=1 Tax=Nonomuraea sp. NPDC001636 TaxID=3154391 RepID=UPI003319E77D
MTQAPRRAGRPAVLTVERIVAAAVGILDAEGPDALTMRRLGADLGVAAMSLYRHVPNRDALVSLVVGRLFTEAMAGYTPVADWPRALTGFAVAYRRFLLAHPRAVPLLATHPVDVRLGTELISGLLARFEAAGVPSGDTVNAVQSVAVYVLGHALAQVGSTAETHDPDALRFYDQWFDAGLRAMVSGFEQQLAARR